MDNLRTNELLYLYRESQNRIAFDILINRFFNKLYFTMIKKYNSQYYNLPFEKEDFYSLTYEYLTFSINSFNYLQTDYKFEQFCFITTKTFIFKEVKRFLKPTHTCLNQALSYSRSISDCSIIAADDIIEDGKLLERIENENALSEFNEFTNSIKNETTRMIFKLRAEGFKNREIAIKLGLTPKQVTNKFYSIFSKCRKNIV